MFNPDPLQVLADVAHHGDLSGRSSEKPDAIRNNSTVIKWRNRSSKLLVFRDDVVAGVKAIQASYAQKTRMKESAKAAASKESSREDSDLCARIALVLVRNYTRDELTELLSSVKSKVSS